MITLSRALPIFVLILTSTVTEAELLISEGFEGPNTLNWHDGTNWRTIPNFVGPGFNADYADAKQHIAKATGICRSGNQCIQLCGEFEGGTCEFWTNQFSPHRTELWVTWWEKLSPSYDINEGHKWLTVSGDFGGGPDWTYINWQSWSGATNNTLSSRAFNARGWNCEPAATFAPTTNVLLPLNQWYQYKLHVKLNSSGQSDGAWQVWVKKDGTNWENVWNLQNRNNIRCGGFTNDIHAIMFNGTRIHPGDGQPDSFGTKWIDDIKIGTTEADVDSSGGSSSIAAPTTLRVISN